ncbi:hypothetical protein [Dulcicalothrix desertica]|uniref:hypothetical protein n=1 Tax=Dulcicalothrix desertica TaxID=32056 RepID=UPI001648D39B|nr:hypothetical protein [Dulcicalothrix desertica]
MRCWFATDITDVTDDLFVTNKIFKLSAPSNNESTIRYIRFTSVANLPAKIND